MGYRTQETFIHSLRKSKNERKKGKRKKEAQRQKEESLFSVFIYCWIMTLSIKLYDYIDKINK